MSILVRLSVGSSPLARGLLASGFSSATDQGIIPARAGFTLPVCETGVPRADHPRSRGVYISRRKIGASGGGSSPLARGLRIDVADDVASIGIIPARAGFT